jgi:elongation factor Ts
LWGFLFVSRINKWLGEIVLLDQPLVVSGDWDMTKPPTVSAVLADASKSLGVDVKIAGMARFLVGEGVQTNKSSDSFAKEVAEKIAKAK